MPRRNHHRDRRSATTHTAQSATPPPTYEAMARQLVASGKCSPLILDRPQSFTTQRDESA